MPASVGKGYDRIPQESHVRAPMRGLSLYANSASISFFKLLASHLQERITLDPVLHLAITSDKDFKLGPARWKDMRNLLVWSTSLQWAPVSPTL